MATTERSYTGNGSTTDYTFPFPYRLSSDIKVSVDEVLKTLTTHYSLHNATTIRFVTAPADQAKIRIYRDTASDELSATFYPGSAIRSSDLNDNYTQNLYVTQEAENDATTALNNSRVLESGAYVSAITKATTAVNTSTTASNNATTALNNSREDDGSGGYTSAIAKATTAVNTANTASGNVASKLDKGGGEMTGAITFDDAQTFNAAKIETGLLPLARINTGLLPLDRLHVDAVVTQAEQAGVTSPLDTHVLTAKASDARYFLSNDTETLESTDTWVADNTKIATALAVDNRVTFLVEEVGGFRAIANELSFPNTNPDINNNAGTLISIKALDSAITSNSSGEKSITNGRLDGGTVIINDLGDTKTYAAGFGMIVETTSTDHTYKFHRQLAKPTEVSTLATNISSINTVATNNSNINSVAGNATNINAAATNATNINAVAGELLHSKDLGLITATVESEDGNNDINTIATNIGKIQSFSDQYKVADSAPGGPAQGNLWYDSTNTILKYWNGSSWQAISDGGIESLVVDTTPELGGNLDCNDKNLTDVAIVSGTNLQIDFGTL